MGSRHLGFSLMDAGDNSKWLRRGRTRSTKTKQNTDFMIASDGLQRIN